MIALRAAFPSTFLALLLTVVVLVAAARICIGCHIFEVKRMKE